MAGRDEKPTTGAGGWLAVLCTPPPSRSSSAAASPTTGADDGAGHTVAPGAVLNLELCVHYHCSLSRQRVYRSVSV
jgi:hypothetical protein